MNEMRLPEQSEPPPPALPPRPIPETGSLARGFGLAWLIIVAGHVILFGLAVLLSSVSHGASGPAVAVAALAWFLPELVTIAVGIWLLVSGRRRTGLGVMLGLASVWAVCLLLVAACFGVMVSSWGH
jgi:hypothetical protein